ncbi:hypothetical protein Tco_1098805 [Tanacetum coccineum]
MALPWRNQRHPYLRFEEMEYIDADIHTFKERLERIFRRQILRDMTFCLRCLETVAGYQGTTGAEWVLKFFSTCRFDDRILDFKAPSTLQFQLRAARRRMS